MRHSTVFPVELWVETSAGTILVSAIFLAAHIGIKEKAPRAYGGRLFICTARILRSAQPAVRADRAAE